VPTALTRRAEQAARGDPALGGTRRGVCRGAVAVLEDLDADHDRIRPACRQGVEVAVDQSVPPVRHAPRELVDRLP